MASAPSASWNSRCITHLANCPNRSLPTNSSDESKKKELTLSLEDRRLWIDPQHARLTIQQQCELLSLPRSTYYYQPRPESAENLRLMRRLDELYLECPFFGSRRMAVMLGVNRKRAPAAHGDYGNRSSLSETELELPGAGSRDLPIPAARPVDRAAQPGLEHRYYIYSDAWRVPLPGRCHGLVQPLRAELGTLQYHGDRLLSGCAGSRVPLRPTRDLELRSGVPIHRREFPGAREKARLQDQHGWTRPRPGQGFHRATVAQLEVRAYLSRRLRQWGRPVSGVGPLLPFLIGARTKRSATARRQICTR